MRDRRPRLDDEAYRDGIAYLLTFCTAGRVPVFRDAGAVAQTVREILRAATDTGVAISAYCFMPDHVHLFAEPADEGLGIQTFVKRAKQFSGYCYARETGRRLWQPSWHDRVIRRSDDRRAVLRYVLRNPLRAGLVVDLADCPFVGPGTGG